MKTKEKESALNTGEIMASVGAAPAPKREKPLKLILIALLCVIITAGLCAFLYIQLSPALQGDPEDDGLLRLTEWDAPYLVLNGNEISLKEGYDGALPEHLIIPDYFGGKPVTSVAEKAFENTTGIKKVSVSKSVTTVGKNAFANCASLENVSMPSVKELNANTFMNCPNLKSVSIPAAKVIHSKCFYSCESLTELDAENVTSLGNSAFEGCRKLSGFKTDKITKFGKRALADTGRMEKLVLCDGAALSKECFSGADIVSVSYGESVKLAEGAFKNCKSLTYALLPSYVTSIPKEFFAGCTLIDQITIESTVTSIGESAFEGCYSLKNAEIAGEITVLEPGVFRSCESLETIILPDSLTEIGDGAFQNCRFTNSITLPNSVTKIGNNAFEGCELLSEINVPFGVVSIGDRAFANCTVIRSLALPSSLVEIGEEAFNGCIGLTKLDIPATVTTLGDGALMNCTSLQTLGLYCEASGITGRLTQNCTSLTSIKVSSFSKTYSVIDGILFSADKSQLLIYPAAKGYDYYTLPNYTTSIGAYAFSYAGLRTVYLNRVEMVGMNAFERCRQLTAVDAKNLTFVGYEAFKGCALLSEITFSDSLSEISAYAFSECNSLAEVKVSGEASIDISAFPATTTIHRNEEE